MPGQGDDRFGVRRFEGHRRCGRLGHDDERDGRERVLRRCQRQHRPDGAWTLKWTANSACGTAPSTEPADQKNFECELATTAPVSATSTYAGLRTKAEALLAATTETSSLSTALQTAVDSYVSGNYGTPRQQLADAADDRHAGQLPLHRHPVLVRHDGRFAQ